MSDSDAAAHDEFYKSLLGDFLGESEQLLVALNENLCDSTNGYAL